MALHQGLKIQNIDLIRTCFKKHKMLKVKKYITLDPRFPICTGCPKITVAVFQGCHFICIIGRLMIFSYNVDDMCQFYNSYLGR